MSRLRRFVGRHSSTVRNFLVSFGVFWLSLWTVVPLAWLFGKLNARIIYGDSVLAAIAMGVMTSLGRAVAATLAGALVTLTADDRKPERWAFVVAVLYVIDAPVRQHWYLAPTAWDRLWQSVDLLFPAVACIAAAVITARLQRKASDEVTGVRWSGPFRTRLFGLLAKASAKLSPALCVAAAFLPLAIAASAIHADIGISSGWGVFFNPINLAAYFWLGVTCVYYRRARTRGAAWLFALFPIAFAEPALVLWLWISTTYSPK